MITELHDLSKYRLERACECLNDAKLLLENKRYNGAANRSYYAIFQAMRAVLALDGIDMKKHTGIMGEFRKLYIKTGVFNSRMSDIISALFKSRQDSDYDDFYVISIEETCEQVADAEYFLDNVKVFLDTKY